FEGESLNTSAGPVKYSQLTVMEKFFAVEVLYVHYDNIYIADSFLGTTYYDKAQTKRCVKRRLELRDKLYANQLVNNNVDFIVTTDYEQDKIGRVLAVIDKYLTEVKGMRQAVREAVDKHIESEKTLTLTPVAIKVDKDVL
ncbi:MAG: hypothetical protein PHS45_01970, partial [Bacilli bacterium]|nr:hypothetical protein [Bacilli bacterium]